MKQKILVIGGTRFIGKEIIRRAIAKGHEVAMFNRGITPHALGQIFSIHGDIDAIKKHEAAIKQWQPTAIIHCIANNERHSEDMVSMFANTGIRLLVLSSQDCYEAFYQLVRGKDVGATPVAESDQVCLQKHYWSDISNDKHGKEYDKNLMTQVLMNAHTQGTVNPTVFRLGMIYGPGDNQYVNRHGPIIRRIYDKQQDLLLGEGEQARMFTYGYVENIAEAILHCLDHPNTVGKIYNLGELKSRSWRSWAETFAQVGRFDFQYRIVPDALRFHSPIFLSRPPSYFLADCHKFYGDTGFVDPVDLRESVQRTLDWALIHPESLGPKPDYEKEQKVFKSYEAYVGKKIG